MHKPLLGLRWPRKFVNNDDGQWLLCAFALLCVDVCQQRCSPPLNHVPMYFVLVLNYLGTWLSNQIRTMRIAALSLISRIWRIRLHSTHAPTAMRQSQGQNSHFADSHVLMPAVRTQTLQVRRNHPYQSVDTSPIYTPIHSYNNEWILYKVLTALTAFVVATTNLSPTILMNSISYNFSLFCYWTWICWSNWWIQSTMASCMMPFQLPLHFAD